MVPEAEDRISVSLCHHVDILHATKTTFTVFKDIAFHSGAEFCTQVCALTRRLGLV
jgi:hypothetical protein